jgi:hypothetical protein
MLANDLEFVLDLYGQRVLGSGRNSLGRWIQTHLGVSLALIPSAKSFHGGWRPPPSLMTHSDGEAGSQRKGS